MSYILWGHLKQKNYKSEHYILPVSSALDSVSKCHPSPHFQAVQEGSQEAGFNSAAAFKCAYF